MLSLRMQVRRAFARAIKIAAEIVHQVVLSKHLLLRVGQRVTRTASLANERKVRSAEAGINFGCVAAGGPIGDPNDSD